MRIRAALAIYFLLPAAVAVEAGPSPIVRLDVSFEVVNKNDSLVPCASDGNEYRIVGTLVARESELDSPHPPVTVYLSTSANVNLWSVPVAGYEHAAEMAALGHPSLVLDQLGYGRSDIPRGTDVCVGSLADIAMQLAGQLRAGAYTSTGAAPAFARVSLAGVSMSGNITEAVAYSFPDAYDGYVISGWAPPQFRPEIAYFAAGAMRLIARCNVAPEEKRPESAGGYAAYFDDGELSELSMGYRSIDPAVLAAIEASRERDACGVSGSQGRAAFEAMSNLERASKPILVVLGDHDVFGAPELYAARFAGSHDARWCLVPDAGHFWMVEHQAPLGRALLADWLADSRTLDDRASCGRRAP